MDIVYLITDTVTDLKYLGSKKNWKGENTYWGSLSCKNKRYKKYELQQEWKRNLKLRLNTFKFEILESYENIPHKELLKIELSYQYTINKRIKTVGYPWNKGKKYHRKNWKPKEKKLTTIELMLNDKELINKILNLRENKMSFRKIYTETGISKYFIKLIMEYGTY